METILKANRIPFRALDIATDEKARMLWGRRAGKDETGRPRKIPGLVQMGLVVGDLVEVEEWNEYGELKQHIKIVPIGGTPSGSAAPTPTTTPSKAPAVAKENIKPAPVAAESSKLAEPVQQAAAAPSSFTLAMRQAGQEAAQKAKDSKKKPAETLEGVGEAEPTKESQKSAVKPPPITVLDLPPSVESTAALQSPGSSAWRRAPGGKFHSPKSSLDNLESLQSPNSTAWKPTDTDAPVLVHRGSTISEASEECIKQVEEDEKILEEDEDAEED